MPVRLKIPARLLRLALIPLFTACNSRVRLEAAETLPVDAMYTEAKTALDEGEIDRAVKFYERLAARFPYGKYHEQAQIELAYALYKDNKPDEALSAINRFIKIYPTHPRIDYAYYLRGLVNFNRRIGLLEKYFSDDITRRGLQYVRQSFQDDSGTDARPQLEAFVEVLASHRRQLEQQLDDIEVTLAEIEQHAERCRALLARAAPAASARGKGAAAGSPRRRAGSAAPPKS